MPTSPTVELRKRCPSSGHPGARHDLAEIYIRIHFRDPEAAERTLADLERRSSQLAVFPRSGMRRSDIGLHIRTLAHGPYLILYEVYPDTDDGPVELIEIARVVDLRYDLRKVLR